MALPRIELDPRAWRDAWRAFAGSRLLVLAAATLGAVAFPFGETASTVYPLFLHPFDGWVLGDVLHFLFSPFFRWDAVWYVQIADTGYEPHEIGGVAAAGRPVYFPLYPLLIKALGGGTSAGAGLLAGCAISLAAFLGALYLLHRLVALELGEAVSGAAVKLLAFSPVAYFFSAPYTESLFLLESVAAVYAARRRRWLVAGLLAALASATRNVGVMLVIPLALLYLYDPDAPARAGRLRPRRLPGLDLLGCLALAPLGLVAYSAYLKADLGDPQAWRHAQGYFGRPDVVNPLEGIRQGTAAAVDALQGVVPHDLQFPVVLDWVYLVLLGIAFVGVFRTLPFAYGAYSLALVLPAICAPYVDAPLSGLPRYSLVAFPVFMWLGHVCERAGITDRVVVGFAAALSFLTAAFASWQHPG